MGSARKGLYRLLILGAAVLVCVFLVLLTPLGPWLGRGARALWRGVLRLPGIAWALEQWGATPTSEANLSQTDTEAIQSLLQQGQQARRRGAYEEALRLYRQALEQAQDYAPTHVALAELYYAMGELERSIEELERAASLAPDNAFIFSQLGQLYLQAEDYEGAVQALQRASELDPAAAEVRFFLGLARYRRSFLDAKAAVQALEEAVKLRPQQAEIHYQLGLAYMRRDDEGDEERAIAAFERTLALDPDQVEAYYHLGHLYLSSAQVEKAIVAWQRYVAASDDQETVALVRSWLQELEQRTQSGGLER
jgi:tetratricopeptide (TPR) repeat protein